MPPPANSSRIPQPQPKNAVATELPRKPHERKAEISTAVVALLSAVVGGTISGVASYVAAQSQNRIAQQIFAQQVKVEEHKATVAAQAKRTATAFALSVDLNGFGSVADGMKALVKTNDKEMNLKEPPFPLTVFSHWTVEELSIFDRDLLRRYFTLRNRAEFFDIHYKIYVDRFDAPPAQPFIEGWRSDLLSTASEIAELARGIESDLLRIANTDVPK
jgi:hypothetical protein